MTEHLLGILRFTLLILAIVVAAALVSRFHRPPGAAVGVPEFSNLAFPTPPGPATPTAPVTPPPVAARPPPSVAKPRFAPLPRPAPLLKPVPSIAIPLPPPPPAPLPSLNISDQEFYGRFAPAVIQIFCQTPQEIFTASGVIVNERGLVLTNAHVAEIVRTAGEPNCQARHGNPAERFATLQIVFAADTSVKITGTNVPQRDFAFLRLVAPTEPFSVAAITIGVAAPGTALWTLGYPSEFLQSLTASSNSNFVFSSLRVDGYIDVDDTPASAEGYVFRGGLILQQGSSGTALFAPDGTVVGLIFATTRGATTADREGVAFTTPYMDIILRAEAGQGLADFIGSH